MIHIQQTTELKELLLLEQKYSAFKHMTFAKVQPKIRSIRTCRLHNSCPFQPFILITVFYDFPTSVINPHLQLSKVYRAL